MELKSAKTQYARHIPYIDDIGFTIIKHKIDINQYLINLYPKVDTEQFDYIKEINPHIDKFAMPGDMLLLMNKPPRKRKLSEEAKEDLRVAQKEAQEVSSIRKTLPESSEESELNVELAAIDTSCLNVDNHVTECTDKRYGSFDTVKSQAKAKEPTQQDVMNFFQVLNDYSISGDSVSDSMTAVGSYTAARENAMKDANKILKNLNDLYKAMGKGSVTKEYFIQEKQNLLKKLESPLSRNMLRKIDIASDGKLKSQLKLSTKATIHRVKTGNGRAIGIKGYSQMYVKAIKAAKVLKIGGYAAAISGTAQTAYNAYTICHMTPNDPISKKYDLNQFDLDQACYAETSTAIAKSSGSIAGGIGGGAVASYYICNVALGLETLGTSIFWCALIVGGAGAIIGGKTGSLVEDKFNDVTHIWDNDFIKGKANALTIHKEWDLYK